MDALQADVLRTIDPAKLGQRIRAARVAKGLTQGELAGEHVSIAYVSRIESGHRRPNPKVLGELASRLDLPVEQLLMGVAPKELDEIRLGLDYAELSLESGQGKEAEAQAREATDRADAAGLDDLAERGRYLHARATEALGELDDAIIELESLIEQATNRTLSARAGIALSRCYRESGDLTKAIETGERILDQLSASGLDSCDEGVQMAVTLAAAYFERGDVGHALRVCRRAIVRAEELGSPTARASAYWNASILEAERGHHCDAIPLAERALALLGEGNDARNLARLRTELGIMQLHVDPPQVLEAQQNLEQAAREMAWSSAAPVDVARNDIALCHALLLIGDFDQVRELSAQIYDAVLEHAPAVAADARSIQGQAYAAQGDTREAVLAYREAVHILTAVGADRGAAQLWFNLAGLLEDVGEMDAAREAYKSAASSVGLLSRITTRVLV
jgi:tetratricopeptide (TPR) repeat protein